MRRSTCLRQTEFKQKSRWDKVFPKKTYGHGILLWGPRATCFWNWKSATTDSNRLINHAARYQHVIDSLDVTKNEEELSIPLNDVRTRDHRILFRKCVTCGKSYRQSPAVEVTYRRTCIPCKYASPSTTMPRLFKTKPLQTVNASLAKEINSEVHPDAVKQFDAASPFFASWKCKKCDKPYMASIRSRTGRVTAGGIPLPPTSMEAVNGYCESCRWDTFMSRRATETLAKGCYLGLEESLAEIKAASSSSSKTPATAK